MANPQYPMPPLGQMPSHLPQPGMPPRPSVMPRGTSRAVPVVVSAGLAVGVFCGLVLGLGTGDKAVASPPPGKPLSAEPTPAPRSTSAPTVKPTVAPADDRPAKVEAVANKAKIIVELEPYSIAASAKISVDGNEIIGSEIALDLGEAKKREVTLLIKAPGYKDHEQKVEVEGDTTLKIEMIKRASGGNPSGGGATGGPKRASPPGGNGGKKKPNSALIDI